MSKERIVRYSAEDIEKMITNGEDRSDHARVDSQTSAEIEQAMFDDPDWVGSIDIDWSSATIVQPPAKKPLSIRLDQDVVDFFQATGKGYQTRINAVLRHYVDQQKILKEKRQK
jgi:uncharacterized protein (DUF4415 family)